MKRSNALEEWIHPWRTKSDGMDFHVKCIIAYFFTVLILPALIPDYWFHTTPGHLFLGSVVAIPCLYILIAVWQSCERSILRTLVVLACFAMAFGVVCAMSLMFISGIDFVEAGIRRLFG